MEAEFKVNITIKESVDTELVCELIEAKNYSFIEYYPSEGWAVSFNPGTPFWLNSNAFRVRGVDGHWVIINTVDLDDLEIKKTETVRA